MKEKYFMEDSDDNAFSLIADFEGNEEQMFDVKTKSGDTLPVLPLRNMVLFPGVFMPVSVGRKSSLRLIREAEKKGMNIAVICQKAAQIDEPQFEDLHTIGTIGKIVRILEMPDQTTTVILQGLKRLELKNITEVYPYLKGQVEIKDEEIPDKTDKEFQALVETCKDLTIRYIKSSDSLHQDSAFAIKNINNHMFLVDFICTNLPLKKDEKIELLRYDSLRERTYRLLEILNREVQLAEIKASIQMRAREDIDQQQREYFLQQQIKTIQDELGGSGQEQEIEEMRNKSYRMKWGEEIQAIFLKELAKLERSHPQSPDYSVQLNYLQTMLSLPWGIYTTDNLNLKNAEKTLNKDHYGLEKVKERILEHLAVLKLKGDMKSPIICLYGPPGVGKTSLGKSIAAALKRKYIRMSLGGVHDEAEIRGHRKTYIGAMPGRIIKSLIKAGSSNPVFILDEIDKVSSDYKGDVSSALLEVLDGEQNKEFNDHYFGVPVDLSNVLFIATANDLSGIPGPLLDRMEVINISGYTENEKYHIAKLYLVEKTREKNGLTKSQFKIDAGAIREIISHYTREAGVRSLERNIDKVCRKACRKILTGEMDVVKVTKKNIQDFLGPYKYKDENGNLKNKIGAVRGLAWTAVGGVTLEIEVNVLPGTGTLQLTGKMGDVMKESAYAGMSYIRSLKESLALGDDYFAKHDFHIHIPEGAVPKDGPSAGITMATALYSAIFNVPVNGRIAMTGEITLRGEVLPIGGLKEKLLAAKMIGVKDILIPSKNESDYLELDEEITSGVNIHLVEDMRQVLDLALVR